MTEHLRDSMLVTILRSEPEVIKTKFPFIFNYFLGLRNICEFYEGKLDKLFFDFSEYEPDFCLTPQQMDQMQEDFVVCLNKLENTYLKEPDYINFRVFFR